MSDRIDAPNWLEYLNKHKYFDVDGFFDYLDTYKCPQVRKSEFVHSFLYNVMLYAAENYNYDEGEFLHYLDAVIPYVTFSEIAKFASKEMKGGK